MFKSVFLLLAMLLSSYGTSYAQSNIDIGILTSSFERDRIQIEQRFGLSEKFTLITGVSYGSNSNGSYHSAIEDTNMFTYIYRQKQNFGSVKIGVSRKLLKLPTDYFYFNSTLNIGLEQSDNRAISSTYNIGSNPASPYEGATFVSSTEENFLLKGFYYQFNLGFGMDVPLTSKILVNCQLNGSLVHSIYSGNNFQVINIVPSVSGGVRYKLGKGAQ